MDRLILDNSQMGDDRDQLGVKLMNWKRFQPHLQVIWKNVSGSEGEISFQPCISNGGWNVVFLTY